MKVYVVEYVNWDECDIQNIFSTQEKAEEYIRSQDKSCAEYLILTEWDVC